MDHYTGYKIKNHKTCLMFYNQKFTQNSMNAIKLSKTDLLPTEETMEVFCKNAHFPLKGKSESIRLQSSIKVISV